MNRIFTFLFLLLPFFGTSQAVFESDDFADVGDEYLLSIVTTGLVGVDFSMAGADVNWDFSSFSPDEQRNQNWIDPGTAGFQLTWCFLNGFIFDCNAQFDQLTNLALQEDGETIDLGTFSFSNITNHYRRTANALELTMIGATVDIGLPVEAPFDYTIPDTILEFPVEYGNTGSSYSEFELDLSDLGFNLFLKSTATRTNTVDGWGSLSTPYADYDSVLRVHSTIERNDTIIFDGTVIPIPSTLVEIRWLDPDFGIPVMEASGISAAGLEIITEVRYPDTVQCLAPDPFFAYNPAFVYFDAQAGSAVVAFNNFSDNADTWMWDFGDGNTSTDGTVVHEYLCPGDYTVSLTATNSCNPDISETTSLPLIVIDTTDYFQTTLDLQVCEGDSVQIGDDYYSQPGTYEVNTVSSNGCDSTVTATITFMSVNTETILDGAMLTALATDATFQWVDCENDFEPVSGATNATFSPSVSGTYAVEVTQGGCTERSECMVVVVSGIHDQIPDNHQMSLSPNPSPGLLLVQVQPILSMPGTLYVIDGLGRILQEVRFTDLDQLELDVRNLPAGMYFLRLTSGNGSQVLPFQKI